MGFGGHIAEQQYSGLNVRFGSGTDIFGTSPSLNHIVCSGQHYFWYGNTKGFGGLEINV